MSNVRLRVILTNGKCLAYFEEHWRILTWEKDTLTHKQAKKRRKKWRKKETISVVILFTPRNAQTNDLVVVMRAGIILEYWNMLKSAFANLSCFSLSFIVFCYHSSSISSSYTRQVAFSNCSMKIIVKSHHSNPYTNKHLIGFQTDAICAQNEESSIQSSQAMSCSSSRMQIEKKFNHPLYSLVR